jgi:hypothetical protein
MKNLYYDLYPAEYLNVDELRVFLFCGNDNIPNECFCGCGNKRLFNNEEQQLIYNKKKHYRFFHNANHIKRFKNLNKPKEYIFRLNNL